MIIRHITTTVISVSSFCFGVWLERKYRAFNFPHCTNIAFEIFDAVNADSVINNNQQLIINNEHRISEVRLKYYNKFIVCSL